MAASRGTDCTSCSSGNARNRIDYTAAARTFGKLQPNNGSQRN